MIYEMVIYHSQCSDGFASAWIAHNAGCEGAVFVPARYGTAPPDVAGKRVLILDFSYKRPVMRRILSQATRVTALDHHATAEKELAGLVDEFVMRPDIIANPPGSELPLIHFDMTKSGARLAWEHFHPGERSPAIVDFVEDRDLWSWKLDDSREINAAIRSYPMTFDDWDDLAWCVSDETARKQLVIAGSAILRYQQQVIDQHVARATVEVIGGYAVPCVNATVLFSEIAGELAKGQAFGACWFIRSDGRKVYSLRSEEEGVDVSEVARLLGGGGHPRSAGFEEE